MNRGCRTTIALVLLFASPALADEFSDFRVPAHHLLTWDASLSSDFFAGAHGVPGRYVTNSNADGRLGTELYWLGDSDPSRSVIDVALSADVVHAHSTSDESSTYPGLPIHYRMSAVHAETDTDPQWSLSLEQRRYPWDGPVGFIGTATGRGLHAFRWVQDSQERFQADTTTSSDALSRRSLGQRLDAYAVNIDCAAGLGHVRDVSSVYDARLFEHRLLAAHAITRPLSAVARQRLIGVFTTRSVMDRVHDRAEKYAWAAIEDVLRSDGVLAGSVDAPAAIRATEPVVGPSRSRIPIQVPFAGMTRTSGAFVGPLLRYAHEHTYVRNTVSYYDQFAIDDTVTYQHPYGYYAHFDASESDVFLFGGRAEYHRPIGMMWQVDASSEMVMPRKHPEKYFDLSTSASARAVLADRWTAGVLLVHERRVLQDLRVQTGDLWHFSMSGDLQFFLEDRLALVLQASQTQDRDRYAQSFTRSTSARLVLSYSLYGRLAAPGVFATQHTRPPLD